MQPVAQLSKGIAHWVSHALSNRLHSYAEYTTQAQALSSQRARLTQTRPRTSLIIRPSQTALGSWVGSHEPRSNGGNADGKER